MLDIIKSKLFNISGYESSEVMKQELCKLAADIEKYQQEDATSSDLHRAFRTLERYSNMYKIAVDDYLAISVADLEKRSFKLQDILCLLTLITSIIVTTLRKYNTAEDKGALGRHIRTLNNNLEFYKNEKISWTTMLKAISTLIEERITDKKAVMQENNIRLGGGE